MGGAPWYWQWDDEALGGLGVEIRLFGRAAHGLLAACQALADRPPSALEQTRAAAAQESAGSSARIQRLRGEARSEQLIEPDRF